MNVLRFSAGFELNLEVGPDWKVVRAKELGNRVIVTALD